MNLEFIIENIPEYFEAIGLTIGLSALSILLSIIIGIVISIVIYIKVPIVSITAKIYIELSRNTPLLIQLFFLYYGLTKIGISLSGYTCGVIGLTFLGGSYMAESFRSGLESVSSGQIQAALSIGLTKIQAFRYVIIPQAFSIAIPSVGANCLFLIKETSVVGSIAVAELMFLTKDLIGMYYKTTEALFLLVISYLIILLPISIIIRKLERKSRYAEYGL